MVGLAVAMAVGSAVFGSVYLAPSVAIAAEDPVVCPTGSPTPSPTVEPTAEPTATPTPSPTIPAPPVQAATYQVVGKDLQDPNGATVEIRGLEQSMWNAGWLAPSMISDIGRTGANTVRILPYYTLNTPTGEPRSTLAQIETMIRLGINAHMLVDVAIDGGKDPNVWLRPEVKALMLKYSKYIVVHAKGEAYEPTHDAWAAEATRVVTMLRAAGYTMPLYVMTREGGRNLPAILAKGSSIQSSDPLHRVVFGWQAYWGNNNAYQNAYGMTLAQAFSAVASAPFPIQVGLIWHTNPWDIPALTVDYAALMADAEAKHIGWLWWDYRMGKDNVTQSGVYGQWTTWGAKVVSTDPNSIQATSVRTPFQVSQQVS